MRHLDSHLIRGSLDPHVSAHPKQHLDQFSLYAQLTHVPNTQTLLRATSLAIGRIHALHAG